ncbi:COG4223 family protein [Acidiphilium sp.]|uniref:COG4223 family protein n=1 Tax=Acidiphilium sp. TaxID=527 RepID=UPI003CFBC8A0
MTEPDSQPIPPTPAAAAPQPDTTAPSAPAIGPTADDPEATPDPAQSAPATRAPARTPLILGAILILLLAGGEAWLFNAQTGAADRAAALGQQIDTLKSDVAALHLKLATTNDKLAALASPSPQPAAAPSAAAPPQAAPPPAKVEAEIPPALASQIKTMQASIASLTTTALADHASLTTLQATATDLPKLVAHAQSLAQIASASLALENGTPLGTIANAPEALVRYATTNPPTLGALQASFPAYAAKATAAAGDITSHGGFWRDVKGRIESLITIRHHNDVLVGSRASFILGTARSDLDRGDLPATLTTLGALPPAAQTIMAPWITQARHLLAARAALIHLAQTAGSP